jgi:hypothetical protein
MPFRWTKMSKIVAYIENYVRIRVLYTKSSLVISQRKNTLKSKQEDLNIDFDELKSECCFIIII